MSSAEAATAGEEPLRSERDIVLARQLVRRMSQQQGFSLVDQTKMVTAASELARNALIYGGGGVMRWELLSTAERRGLRLVFADEGPGIPNLEIAMTDGWTSGHGMGMGLSGAKRLVNDFEIETRVGGGTRVSIARWK
ncbi:MAG TPA: anti-sigma regulatory factor [Steroidobacteraceae bacterium]|jgi:serine/threonine-protein kinase RsbT|nr:anti-sigma regulatory factor [Steroidobacteraceae bacterium]